MDTSLNDAREVNIQGNRIITRFAANPEGPLDGSIHPAFRFSPNLLAPIDGQQVIVAPVAIGDDIQVQNPHSRVQVQEDRFKTALKDYESTVKEKYKTGVEVHDSHSVEQLWQIIDKVIDDYSLQGEEGVWKKVRTGFRQLGDASGAIQGWLGLLPNESEYLSVVCGGLKLILKAASRLRSIADDVLSELARIPSILSSVQRVLKIFPGSTKLVELSDAIYHSVLVALGRMLEYLKRKACRKFMGALIKQDVFQSDLQKAIKDIEVSRDEFNAEADLLTKEAIQTLQDTTVRSGQQINDAILHLNQCISIARTEQERSNQKYQEYFNLMCHSYDELMRYLLNTLKSNSKVNEIAYNEVKRLPNNAEFTEFRTERRLSLIDRIHKPQVRPSQARKALLRRLDYDPDVASQDVISNYQFGPTLNKDEQERCLYAIKSSLFARWMESETPSLLVINGDGSGTGQRKSGLSFLCARLVYSLDQIRFGGRPESNTIARPEILPIHFFCGQHLHSDSSESWASPSGIANSLLVQLVSQCKDLDVSQLKPSRYFDLDESNVREVLEIFRMLFNQLPPHFVVFCVIDGLSFYANNDRVSKSARRLLTGLLKLLKKLKKESKDHASFKLLLTAPSRLRMDDVDGFDERQVLNIPKTLPDTGGLNAMKWDKVLRQHLEEV